MTTDRATADAQNLFDRGFENLRTGDFREAVECFTRAIRLRPDLAAVYRYRAMALLELGQRTDALNDLDQAIRRNPDDPQLYAERARVLLRQRAYELAIADCERSLTLDPGLAPMYGLRAECHAAQGNTNAAMSDFATAIERDPDHTSDYLLARARLFLGLEDYDSCIADCTAAVVRTPDAKVYQVRGLAHRDRGDLSSADDDLTLALDLDPTVVLTWLARATVRAELGRFAEAKADCDGAIALAPTLAKGYELRGNCRRHLGDIDDALADYTEAIRLAPGNAPTYNLRAALHYMEGRYKEALQDHLESLKRNPHSAATFNQLGWIWATAPDPDVRNGSRAVECATRACELTEWQEPNFLDTLAAAHAEVGDIDASVVWQEKAIELAPQHLTGNFHTRLELYRHGKPYRTDPTR